MPIVRVSQRSGGQRLRAGRMGGKRKMKMTPYRFSSGSRIYLRSLLNPSFGGAKIPDSFGGKTCTVQLQREVALEAVHNGSTSNPSYLIGGLIQLSPCAFTWKTQWDSTNSCWKWLVDQYVEGKDYGSEADLNLPKLMRSARVVSGGLKVQFSGTTQNDQGTLTVFAVDSTHLQNAATVTGGSVGNPAEFGWVESIAPIGNAAGSGGTAIATAIDGSKLRGLPINAYGPLRQGGTARFFPIHDRDLEFNVIPPVGSAMVPVGSVGALGFIAQGVSSSATVIVQYTVNIECTVKEDSFNMVTTEASPVDPNGLAAAATVYLKKAQVRVGGLRGDTESINVYSR